MAGYSSRRDQLWYFAVQLAAEETKSIQFAQQEEETGQRIQSKYNQLVSNLSCLGDIIAMMYQEDKLSLKELEHIQSLQSTPIRANEELLSIIARKPRDIYEYFLSLIKKTNQLHLYQMLVSGDETCDKANREVASDHKDLICRNFMWLSEKLDTANGLITLLYQRKVLTVREKERIFCMNDTFQKNELLLGLLSKKSSTDFVKFLEALEQLGQGHLTKELRNPEESMPSAVQTPMSIRKELLPKELLESGQKPDILPSSSKPITPPKTLPKPGHKLIPSRSLSKPVPPPKPGTQSTAVQHYAKSMHDVSKTAEKTAQYRRTVGVALQSQLKRLEPHLKTEIAIKVTSVYLLYVDRTEDSLKMCFKMLLQECHRMRKETVTRKVEANVELEQLRENVSQYSAATSLNEVFRTQLHSMQQELLSERSQRNRDRNLFEEKINKLKTDIHNEKAKCKRFDEEKVLKNTIIMKLEERLKQAECDKQFFQQQLQELNARLATFEFELQMSKDSFEESNREMIVLRTERDKLMETCEILSKENELRNELEVPLIHLHDNNWDLLGRLKDQKSRPEGDKDETFDLNKNTERKLEEKSFESEQILKLLEELEIERHRRKELELTYTSEQLEELDPKPEGINFTSLFHDNHVIRNNHQFLVENINSGLIIDLLHEKNCITDEERDHLSNQPGSFLQNNAFLHWMRTTAFKQDKLVNVLESFRQSGQNFVVYLLAKGGVLIKSKILTKLVKERPSFRLFAKSSSENVEASTEKEAMLIEQLNQQQGVQLSSSQDIADDEIVIVPYCHQDYNGVVIWFWCQSKNAQRNLQSMYASGFLLGKLNAIFKQFSNGNVSSASEQLVPTSVTIFMSDFTKDGIRIASNGFGLRDMEEPSQVKPLTRRKGRIFSKQITSATVGGVGGTAHKVAQEQFGASEDLPKRNAFPQPKSSGASEAKHKQTTKSKKELFKPPY